MSERIQNGLNLFDILEDINRRPALFEYYTAEDLWTDEHTSGQMLSYHLNGDVDVSSRNTAFIEYARHVAEREQLAVRYVNENYLNFETDERFDLVMMIMCDYCAMSLAQRKTILAKFHKILKSGGGVLLDVYSLKAFTGREESASYGSNTLDGFWSSSKYYGFQNTFIYDKEKVVLDKYTIIEPGRTRTVYNYLQGTSNNSKSPALFCRAKPFIKAQKGT